MGRGNRTIVIVGVVGGLMVCGLCGLVALAYEPSSRATPTPWGRTAAQSQPVAATVAPNAGTARTNPLPVGQEAGYRDMAVTVTGSTYPADRQIAEYNDFAAPPGEGRHYLLVELSFRCLKGPDETCGLSPFWFRLVGDHAAIYDHEIMAFVPDRNGVAREMFGGGSAEGLLLPFRVSADDGGFVLIFDPGIGREALYYAVN